MARLSTLLLPVVSDHWQYDDNDAWYSSWSILLLVQAAVNSNTFAIHGRSVEKELTELGKKMVYMDWMWIFTRLFIIVPNILSQLGPDSLASLRKLAEAYTQQGGAGAAGEDDDEIPDLVESFDKAEVEDKKEEKPAETTESKA